MPVRPAPPQVTAPSPAGTSPVRPAPPQVTAPSPAEASAVRSRRPWITVSLPAVRENCGSSAALKIMVDVSGDGGLYNVDATSDHTIYDLKSFFESLKGSNVCPLRKLVASQDGISLSNTTRLEDLNLDMAVSMTVTEVQEKDLCNTDLQAHTTPINSTQDVAKKILPKNCHVWELPFVEFGDFFDSNCTLTDQGQFNAAAIEANPLLLEPQTQTQYDLPAVEGNTSVSQSEAAIGLATTSTPKASEERLLVPNDFSDHTLLESKTHGFRTSFEVRASINSGPPKWITKKQAYAMLSNAQVFSIGAVSEDDKADGRVCLIDSTVCSLPQKVKGYKAAPNMDSEEKTLGVKKCKGIALDCSEVQGQNWIRRRLKNSHDNGFHVVQWRQYATRASRKQEVAAAATNLPRSKVQTSYGQVAAAATNPPRSQVQTAYAQTNVDDTEQAPESAPTGDSSDKTTAMLQLILERQDHLQKMLEKVIAKQDIMEAKLLGPKLAQS